MLLNPTICPTEGQEASLAMKFYDKHALFACDVIPDRLKVEGEVPVCNENNDEIILNNNEKGSRSFSTNKRMVNTN